MGRPFHGMPGWTYLSPPEPPNPRDDDEPSIEEDDEARWRWWLSSLEEDD